jgi:hypothetical protein
MDKLAQKFNTQEMVKMNTQLEEPQRSQRHVAEYEKTLQDMKKVLAELRSLTDEQTRNREAQLEKKEEERMESVRANEVKNEIDIDKLTRLIEDGFQRSDDFVHKENVKVYRNVQAVVVEEIKKYGQSAQNEQQQLQNKINKKLNAAIAVSSAALVASVCTAVMWIGFFLIAAGVIK